MVKPKALIVSSVASMIDQFNIPNIKLLNQMGYEVHVACNFIDGGTIPIERVQNFKSILDGLEVTYHQIDFNRNPFNIWQNYKAYMQLKKVLEYDFDLVHSHSPIGGVLARISTKRYRKKKQIFSVYTAHGFHFYKGAPFFNWLVYYPIEKYLAKYTDILITINLEDFNAAKNFKTKVVYIPGVGIDIQKNSDIEIDKKKKRQTLQIPEHIYLMLSVGELNENKNHEIVIRALAQISNKNIHYAICGQGPLREKLKKITKKLGVENQVHFLGFRQDISEIYMISDLFIFPSYREGLSVSLMEAMSSGLPIIASNIRGNNDLIKQESGGYLVNNQEADEYAARILDCYYNKIDINSCCKYNQNKIEEYSIENVMKLTEEIYTLREV